MRYSAISVFEAAGAKTIKKYLKYDDLDIEEEVNNRNTNTSFVAIDEKEIDFDEAMAKVCANISMKRHAGFLDTVYSPLGNIHTQEGKDLMKLPYLLGTGGVIVNSRNPKDILSAATFTMEDPTSLKPREPKILLDKEYILSAMGLLAMVNANMAVRMLKKYIVEI